MRIAADKTYWDDMRQIYEQDYSRSELENYMACNEIFKEKLRAAMQSPDEPESRKIIDAFLKGG